jgi:hypothetical protein
MWWKSFEAGVRLLDVKIVHFIALHCIGWRVGQLICYLCNSRWVAFHLVRPK